MKNDCIPSRWATQSHGPGIVHSLLEYLMEMERITLQANLTLASLSCSFGYGEIYNPATPAKAEMG